MTSPVMAQRHLDYACLCSGCFDRHRTSVGAVLYRFTNNVSVYAAAQARGQIGEHAPGERNRVYETLQSTLQEQTR